MAAYKSRAFVRSKYDTPFKKTPLKWIPRSKSGALKSRSLWAAHARLGNVWEYPPPPPGVGDSFRFLEGFRINSLLDVLAIKECSTASFHPLITLNVKS